MKIKFVKASIDVEEAVAKVIEELDINKDHVISEQEFVDGLQKWLTSSSNPSSLPNSEHQEDIYQVSMCTIPFVNRTHQF